MYQVSGASRNDSHRKEIKDIFLTITNGHKEIQIPRNNVHCAFQPFPYLWLHVNGGVTFMLSQEKSRNLS